jgi:lysine 2,3-aminomutase
VTSEARHAVDLFLRAGLPVLNQTVLLRGVNDDAATLEALFRALVAARVKPYYLHHPDRVPGGGSFYVEIERGLSIYRELRQRLGGGLALPAYVIDLPDGSGKVPVESLG